MSKKLVIPWLLALIALLAVVQLAGATPPSMGAAQATTSPSEGTPAATATPVPPPNRGCYACHTQIAPDGRYTLAYEAMERMKAQGKEHPQLPFDTKFETCITCHSEDGSKPLSSIVHPAHMFSRIFAEEFRGNCYSCHEIKDGKFTVLVDKQNVNDKGVVEASAVTPNAAETPAPNSTPAAQPTTASASGGLPAADVEKIINDKFNQVDRNLALWNIQPGLGTVMIEYGNRLARMFYAANAGNWDLAKYQLDEMTEIQEVGETTRPARQPMLKAFEDAFLKPIDAAIAAQDKTQFAAALDKAITGCNACHQSSTGGTWTSYKYVEVQTPKTDPAYYVDWKGGGQGNYIANPAAAAPVTPTVLTGNLDAAGAQALLFAKMNKVDRNLALWNIQPGLGTVMIEYGNRWSRLWFAAHGGDWDMAKYQFDEMLEIQEVAEVTRPARQQMLKGFEVAFLTPVDEAIAAKDLKGLEDAFNKATGGCNACHQASTGANWKSYQYVKIQVPTADNNDYLVGNADKGTGNYIANPPAATSPTIAPPPSGGIDAVGVTQLISDTFGTVNRSLALWNIQPGLGTVMIEYGNRFARMQYAIQAGNWDMAKYQLDEMIEIQEVGETTRPARSPMLKAFEDSFLKPLDAAILAKDKTKAEGAWKNALQGCNACHAASNGTNWSSYAYVQVQPPKTDPADYLKWDTTGGTGNYKEPTQ